MFSEQTRKEGRVVWTERTRMGRREKDEPKKTHVTKGKINNGGVTDILP